MNTENNKPARVPTDEKMERLKKFFKSHFGRYGIKYLAGAIGSPDSSTSSALAEMVRTGVLRREQFGHLYMFSLASRPVVEEPEPPKQLELLPMPALIVPAMMVRKAALIALRERFLSAVQGLDELILCTPE